MVDIGRRSIRPEFRFANRSYDTSCQCFAPIFTELPVRQLNQFDSVSQTQRKHNNYIDLWIIYGISFGHMFQRGASPNGRAVQVNFSDCPDAKTCEGLAEQVIPEAWANRAGSAVADDIRDIDIRTESVEFEGSFEIALARQRRIGERLTNATVRIDHGSAGLNASLCRHVDVSIASVYDDRIPGMRRNGSTKEGVPFRSFIGRTPTSVERKPRTR